VILPERNFSFGLTNVVNLSTTYLLNIFNAFLLFFMKTRYLTFLLFLMSTFFTSMVSNATECDVGGISLKCFNLVFTFRSRATGSLDYPASN